MKDKAKQRFKSVSSEQQKIARDVYIERVDTCDSPPRIAAISAIINELVQDNLPMNVQS